MKDDVKITAKLLGDIASNICECMEAESCVVIINRPVGSMVCAGGMEIKSEDHLSKQFRKNAEKLLELAKGMEKGEIKADGEMYIAEGGGPMKPMKPDGEEPNITSFGL